jgi:ADP-ribosylglycohydrolase
MADLLCGLLQGRPKSDVLSEGYYTGPVLDPKIEELTYGRWKRKSEDQIKSTGFVLHSLEAALWVFAATSDFRSGCLRAVNLGGDADTIGAIYGQFAGACYGVEGIPDDWLNRLFEVERLKSLGVQLHALSRGLS